MAYTPNVWRDGPDGRTPIKAANLTRIEDGLVAVTAQADATRALAEQAAAKSALESLQAAFTASLNALVPIGAVLPFWGLQEPTGWLLCKGQAVSRATYKELFAVIGVRSGAGDGTNTFNVPDLRKAVIYGVGDAGSFTQTMGASVGEEAHTLTAAEMPPHAHEIGEFNNHQKRWYAFGTALADTAGDNMTLARNGGTNVPRRAYATPTGGGLPFPVRPKGVVANYIIRAK